MNNESLFKVGDVVISKSVDIFLKRNQNLRAKVACIYKEGFNEFMDLTPIDDFDLSQEARGYQFHFNRWITQSEKVWKIDKNSTIAIALQEVLDET